MTRSFLVTQDGVEALMNSLEVSGAILSRREESDGSTIVSCAAAGSQVTVSYFQPPHRRERPETENLFSVAVMADFWRIFKRSADRVFMDRIASVLEPYVDRDLGRKGQKQGALVRAA